MNRAYRRESAPKALVHGRLEVGDDLGRSPGHAGYGLIAAARYQVIPHPAYVALAEKRRAARACIEQRSNDVATEFGILAAACRSAQHLSYVAGTENVAFEACDLRVELGDVHGLTIASGEALRVLLRAIR